MRCLPRSHLSPLSHFLRLRCAVLVLCLWAGLAQAADTLAVGGKRFTEAYILVELLGQTAQASGTPVALKPGLGNTAIVFAALQSGSIDVYPDYTGTIALDILKLPGGQSLQTLQDRLRPMGLGVAVPLGFHNGYALAMRDDRAAALGVARLGDLAAHPRLVLGLSNEFIGRADGWPGLAQRYKLPQRPQGLDHGLAYDALGAGQVDAIDIYTTDAKIARLGLRVLQDDAGYFPRYDAVLLYRLDVPQRFPAAWAALQRLQGSIDEPTMIAMNARAELDGVPFDRIAREHLAARAAATASGASTAASTASAPPPAPGAAGAAAAPAPSGFMARLFGPDLLRLTLQHLGLVLASVGLAVGLGVPLATWVAPHARLRALVLGATGVLQTVPALALLAVLISLLGRIGTVPALVALTLYALLPVMRNTCTGLAGVPQGLVMAAQALGLTAWQTLRHVELPLALPVIVAGVRTATSIAVGTATIAAFIGAGGYGERIVTGLALNDRSLLLAGALPAAALALLFEAAFALWLRGQPGAGSAAGQSAAKQ
jgi:osmoprotectant transport system permease protein